MANVIYSRILNQNYLTVVSPNLKRVGLFNINTKVYLIDPTTMNATGSYSQAFMDSNQVVFNADFFQATAKTNFGAWTAAGWNPANTTSFLNQLKVFGDTNLPFTLPSYNLVIGTVPYEQPPIFTFENTSLLSFTYNNATGKVSYSGAPNLSAVQVGNKFRDSVAAYFNVTAVDNVNKTVTIVDPNTSLPPTAIATTVLDTRDGAIYSDIGGTITNYALAFFYPGNQGVLLP
jgi:hypothetical protein